jgi:hypothetical protein
MNYELREEAAWAGMINIKNTRQCDQSDKYNDYFTHWSSRNYNQTINEEVKPVDFINAIICFDYEEQNRVKNTSVVAKYGTVSTTASLSWPKTAMNRKRQSSWCYLTDISPKQLLFIVSKKNYLMFKAGEKETTCGEIQVRRRIYYDDKIQLEQ